VADLAPDGFPIPPERLIIRAGATPGVDVVAEYLGRPPWMKQKLVSLLERHGRGDASTAPRILDFGCGAGNVLRHFGAEAMRGEVWGCDIDAASITWLQDNLCPPFRFFTVPQTMVLPTPDDHFDLVYAVSVFTHIAAGWAQCLLELHRSLKPGGVLMATILGEGMIAAERGGLWDPDRIGMNVLRGGQDWEGGGPTVFLSDWWIRAHWGRAFEILDIEHELDDTGAVRPRTHAYVVMRKREVALTAEQLTNLEPDEPREVAALLHNIEQLHEDDRQLREDLIASMKRANTEYSWRLAAQTTAADLAQQLEAVSRSRSWRLTRPLRGRLRRTRPRAY
jgi:SAM-dependent methyltransferase